MRPRIAVALAFVALASSCVTGSRWIPARGPESETPLEPLDQGSLSLVTYNVHGLPRFVAKRDGRQTHPKMVAPLGEFDLVLVQESFWYHHLLDVPLPWHARPRRGCLLQLGDGLARWSRHPLSNVQHVAWRSAHGITDHYNDRLAAKGFAAGTVALPVGRELWVYNVHFDAGGDPGDRKAREDQRAQLVEHIEKKVPAGAALLVAGDFNAGPGSLAEMCERLGLRDAGVGGIDRILLRSAAKLELSAAPIEGDARLAELSGLSDHAPVAVELTFIAR